MVILQHLILETDPCVLQYVRQRVRCLEILSDKDEMACIIEVLYQQKEVELTVRIG